MRRQCTSSVGSYETTTTTTTSSLAKEDAVTAGLDAAAARKKKRSSSLRQKARRLLADVGAPPTARQDAKDGRRTLNYADPGGLVMGDFLSKPVKF